MTIDLTAGSAWTAVCRVDDIPRRGARRVAREGAVAVAVFRTSDDRVFALLDRCPHKGGPLSQGIVSGDTVTCPLHGWNIALGSGQACAPDVGCARRYPVQLRDGAVWLSLAALEEARAEAEAQVA